MKLNSLFFIMKYPTCVAETLKRKFDGQMNACIELGCKVFYMQWDGNAFYLVNKETGESQSLLKTRLFMSQEKYYHTLYFVDMYRAAIKALSLVQFDGIYMRSMPAFPPISSLIRKIKKKKIFFIREIPTYLSGDKQEKRLKSSIVRRIGSNISKTYSDMVISNVDLFTAIGDDTNGTLYNKPALNIDNGIDVSAISMRNFNPQKDTLNFLLLASMCYWHGYDRIITALKDYKGNERVQFHFVGNDGDGSLSKWKALASELGVEDKVVFHGAIYGKELDEFINTIDVGIGSLGMYRIGLETGTIMKAREYMARGIPLVYGCYDPAIEKDCEFAMQVANDDTPLDIDEMVEFALKMREKDNVSLSMRKYAENNMSWTSQFEKIFQKIV